MINAISFTGYSSQIKKLWKAGKLPTVKYGIYGEKLTADNLSVEHLIPVSKGGKNNIGNQVLASKELNNKRGQEDIAQFITFGMIRMYFKQFRNVKVRRFNGNLYIQEVAKTLKGIME